MRNGALAFTVCSLLGAALPAQASAASPTISIDADTRMTLDRTYQVGATATDEDGPIAKFEFDLDGDGTYEVPVTPQSVYHHP